MSLASFLIHVCTIRRISTVVPDPYGGGKETWGDVATDVPCRLIEQSAQLIDNARVALTFVGKYKLLVGPDADLQAGDGVIVDGREFGVTEVLKKNARGGVHHLTALLQEQDE